MPSVSSGLHDTRTARWYQKARSSGSWDERQRCYDALSVILGKHRASWRPYRRTGQPAIHIPGILTEVARHMHFSAHETVYRRWRAEQGTRQIPRWAGQDRGIMPAAAFIDEAKIVAFWPYRSGVLEVADAFNMTVVEMLTAYLRSLAAWASDQTTLAAYSPSGPPACVIEDMEVFAAPDLSRTTRLITFCRTVVELVLTDPSITPLGAFNAVRDEAAQLYPDPERIADRVTYSMAELSDRLMREADRQAFIDASQAKQMLVFMDELRSLLTGTVAGDMSGSEVR